MSEKQINEQELDKVSGGQGSNTSEKVNDYKDLVCPFCYENAVFKIMYVDVKLGGNNITYGPWQCRRCERKWTGSYYNDRIKDNVWKTYNEVSE